MKEFIKEYHKKNKHRRYWLRDLSNIILDDEKFEKFKQNFFDFLEDPNPTFGQIVWHVLNDDYVRHTCECCGKYTKFHRQTFYHMYCSKRCTAIGSAAKMTDEDKQRMIIAREETNTKKYGARYSSMTEEGKQKKAETCFRIYGVSNPLQNKEIHDRQFKSMQESNMRNYGTKSTLGIREVYEKTVKTREEKYGDAYELFKYKDYIMPSGNIERIQGYENKALDILLKTKQENEIIIGFKINKLIGKIEYRLNEHIRSYTPDIYIPNENKIIEVKSTWFFTFDQEKVFAKANRCIELGYKYEFWIFDGKGNLEIVTKF